MYEIIYIIPSIKVPGLWRWFSCYHGLTFGRECLLSKCNDTLRESIRNSLVPVLVIDRKTNLNQAKYTTQKIISGAS